MVGEIEDGQLVLKTFLAAETLPTPRAALHRDLLALRSASARSFDVAAAVGSEAAECLVAQVIARPEHRWLRDPHPRAKVSAVDRVQFARI